MDESALPKDHISRETRTLADTTSRDRRLEQLLERIGSNSAQFFRDGGRIVSGEVELETASHLVAHCAREIESAIREVLLLMLIKPDDLKETADAGAKDRSTQAKQVDAIVSALGWPTDAESVSIWREIASGELAARTHRLRHEPAPPVEEIRDLWRRFAQLVRALAQEVERRFPNLLDPVRSLAVLSSPTKADLVRFGGLPDAFVLRREFFNRATAGWLELLDEGGYFARPHGFAEDPATGERLAQQWPQTQYLARVAREAPVRFAEIAQRIVPQHEFMARDLIIGARSTPLEQSAAVAVHITGYLTSQPTLFLIVRDCSDWARDLIEAGHREAGEGLLRAMLGVGRQGQTVGAT